MFVASTHHSSPAAFAWMADGSASPTSIGVGSPAELTRTRPFAPPTYTPPLGAAAMSVGLNSAGRSIGVPGTAAHVVGCAMRMASFAVVSTYHSASSVASAIAAGCDSPEGFEVTVPVAVMQSSSPDSDSTTHIRSLADATRSEGLPPTVASVTGPIPGSVRPTRPLTLSTNQRLPSPGPGVSTVGSVAAPAMATAADCTPPSVTWPTAPVPLYVTVSGPVPAWKMPVGADSAAASHS